MIELPQKIGRYRVTRVLGRGDMDVSYLAEDPALGRRVAIKVISGSGSERARSLARFRREAEVSARLAGPDVVTIFDVGEDDVVGPFMAMEYIEGQSLSALLQEEDLDADSRLRILIQAGRGLHAARAAGIVHRNVSSQNLTVGSDRRVTLMDFGMASDAGRPVEGAETGRTLGMPAYLAPELIRGEPSSTATDLYAFVVVAFEVYTRTVPYPGDDRSMVFHRITTEPPIFPPGLDPQVRSVFERALSKDPSDRFPDLATFLSALVDAEELEPMQWARLRELLVDHDLPVGGSDVTLKQWSLPRRTGMLRAIGLGSASAISMALLFWSIAAVSGTFSRAANALIPVAPREATIDRTAGPLSLVAATTAPSFTVPTEANPVWYRVLVRTAVRQRPEDAAEIVAWLQPPTEVRVVDASGPYLAVRSVTGRPDGYVRESDASRVVP
jgi:serine/threonine-protein kinase